MFLSHSAHLIGTDAAPWGDAPPGARQPATGGGALCIPGASNQRNRVPGPRQRAPRGAVAAGPRGFF